MRQLENRLSEPIADNERENISGIVRMLVDGTWGRKEPFTEDSRKWIVLVGGKPILAVDCPDEVTKETRATLLASYTGTIFFEPVMLHLKSLISNADTFKACRFRGNHAFGGGTSVGWTVAISSSR